MNYFKKTQSFTSEIGTSRNFYDVLPKNLTLNLNKKLIPCLVETNETMFKEVQRVQYVEQPWVKAFNEELRSMPKKPGLPIQELFDTFCQVIFERWNSSKTHYIGSSSGWDSRLMMMAISSLKKQHGAKWYGKTFFVEGWGEHEPCKQIAEYFGLEKSFINFFADQRPGFTHKFTINDHYKKFNGLVSFPVNQWFDLYPDVKDCQFITGYGSNETNELALKLHDFSWYAAWHYQLQLENINFIEETIQPFWSLTWLRKTWEYPELKKSSKRIPQLIVESLAPDLKAPFLTYDQLSAQGYRSVAPELMNEIIKDYEKSRFGKRISCVPNPVIDYNEWFCYFCMASICEHLIEQGYNITIE